VSNIVPPTEYGDEYAQLAVDGPTGSRPTLRLRAAGEGIGASVELTVTGASRLASMLHNAAVAATARGVPDDDA
jgi:hypothetical protein